MRICFFGIYKPDYPRNDIILEGLKSNNIEVVECREESNDPKRYLKLVNKLRKLKGQYDLIFAAYPAPVPTIVAKIFTRTKVVTDAFLSMYDAAVNDRKEFSRFHPKALKLLFWDWLSVFVADLIFVDTEEHKDYWGSWLFIRKNKIRVIPIGVNPKHIYPMTHVSESPEQVTVTFHGTYIPLQGIDKIIHAFAILKDRKDISFRLIGNGQEFAKIMALIEKLALKDRIEVIEKIPYSQMNVYLNATEIIMGIFGDSLKAKRVVPNKVFEGCAARKAVITADTKAIRRAYDCKEIYMVNPEAQSIAKAITSLVDDKRIMETYAQNGYKKTISDYTPKPIGKLVAGHINELIS